MTESEIILLCQIVIAVGLFCIGFVGGHCEGWASAMKKVGDDCKRDTEILRAIFPPKDLGFTTETSKPLCHAPLTQRLNQVRNFAGNRPC